MYFSWILFADYISFTSLTWEHCWWLLIDIMTSIFSLFKVGLPDEKGEHCEVKKEEKIEPSKYIDVLIQIQHSVNVHYTTYNIPSQDAGCGLGIGEGLSLVCSRYKWIWGEKN